MAGGKRFVIKGKDQCPFRECINVCRHTCNLKNLVYDNDYKLFECEGMNKKTGCPLAIEGKIGIVRK